MVIMAVPIKHRITSPNEYTIIPFSMPMLMFSVTDLTKILPHGNTHLANEVVSLEDGQWR